MTFLLDVNVLIALIDPGHASNKTALAWFSGTGSPSWATCPMTENAVIRIVGHPSYPNSPGGPSAVAGLLEVLVAVPGHVFWPDHVSILDKGKFDLSRMITAKQVTDSYLLALALAHGGQLATLDGRLIPDAVRGGVQGIYLIR
jgi:toxin-antitoxin system PIN domain toxin